MGARLLVLDTSTETLHLGVCDGARAWRRALPGGMHASQRLLPALLALLDEAGLALDTLDAIGVGRGPGAFTGVRAACAVAQGLAFGAGRPVLPLDTLQAVAEDARSLGADGPLWVAVDARMGEAYAAAYEPVDAGWATREAPALHDPAALAARLQAAGNIWGVAGSSLAAHPPAWAGFAGARWPDAAPRASALLALARRAWEGGAACDAAEALPLYVRDKVAQTSAERAALRAGRSE